MWPTGRTRLIKAEGGGSGGIFLHGNNVRLSGTLDAAGGDGSNGGVPIQFRLGGSSDSGTVDVAGGAGGVNEGNSGVFSASATPEPAGLLSMALASRSISARTINKGERRPRRLRPSAPSDRDPFEGRRRDRRLGC